MRHIHNNQAGTTMVEMSIMLPLLGLILLSVVDLAFIFWSTHLVDDASRAGARRAAVSPDVTAEANLIQAEAKRLLSNFGMLMDISITVNPPLNIPGDGVSDQMISVTVNATNTFSMLTILGLVNSQLSSTTVMRWEPQGDPGMG